MALVLRLARHGRKNHPFYRIVAAEKDARRDGRYVEALGSYNNMENPAKIVLNEERARHWISQGAKPSLLVRSILEKTFPGIVSERENHQKAKIQASRKARKARAAKRASAAS